MWGWDACVARVPHLQLYSHQSGNLKTLIVMVARRREISPEMVKSPPILYQTTTILLLSLPQHSSMIMGLMCSFAPLGGKACIPKDVKGMFSTMSSSIESEVLVCFSLHALR